MLVIPLLISTSLLVVCSGLPEPEAGLPLTELSRLRRQATGGKCSTSADCIAPNVCSKWGWCQWTNIYGEDGPSQGSSAPDGGRSGQCVTSVDCASRVPYCSRLGFCHGGRLPFDEEQLEIESGFDQESQGYVNNNPPKNSPVFQGQNNQDRSADRSQIEEERKPRRQQQQRQQKPQQQRQQQRQQQQQSRRNNNRNNRNRNQNNSSSNNKRYNSEDCPGFDYGTCVLEACEPLRNLPSGDRVFGACEQGCKQRCN